MPTYTQTIPTNCLQATDGKKSVNVNDVHISDQNCAFPNKYKKIIQQKKPCNKPFSDVDFTKESSEKIFFFFFLLYSDLYCVLPSFSFVCCRFDTFVVWCKTHIADTKLFSEALDKHSESSPDETCEYCFSELDILPLLSFDKKSQKIIVLRI